MMNPTATEPVTAPYKAISPLLEQFQSDLLVWGWMVTVLPLICVIMAVRVTISYENGRLFTSMDMQGMYLCIVLACVVVALRAATPAAGAIGGVICLATTLATTPDTHRISQTCLTALLTLFVLTFTATRIGRKRKAMLGLAESHRGRAARQIVANLGLASLAALLHGMDYAMIVACIAAMAEATADTVSSELGPLFPGSTYLLTNFRRVAAGTDGGVSLGGTLCGIAAAGIVSIVGVRAVHFTWIEATTCFGASTLGFLFDSLLGATLERRGIIGNDMVNFLSTGMTCVLALVFGVIFMPGY